jgi:RimJ/RimL family protein N-acetyltransferase
MPTSPDHGSPFPLSVAHPRHRIVVRRWHRDDADALVAKANHPQITRFTRDRFPYPYTKADADAFLSGAVLGPSTRAQAIEVDGEPAGGIGFTQGEDVERLSAEIGYWLTPSLWRQGIMTAVLDAFVPAIMTSWGLHRVSACVYAPNMASQALLERSGFQREGVLRQAAIKQGELMDIVVYGRLRDTMT